MTGAIYLLGEGGDLIEMHQQHYEAEELLQELLASYPQLLGSDQGDSQWLLVSRETPVPAELDGSGRWSVDHLFLDREAIPTLVEVKRSSDTRIRREVVGQMLDYAANAVAYWPVETIRSEFERTCREDQLDPAEQLDQFLQGGEPDQFWLQAKTNLQAGRIRLVFVSDQIPPELRRIVEFLNMQMDPAEVLAMEVRQFMGEGRRTLVPRLVGRTAEAERKKSAGRREYRQWDESSFMEELRTRSRDDVHVAKSLLGWARRCDLRIWWGQGKVTGSFIPVLDHGDVGHTFVAAWTNGVLSFQFGYMVTKPVFDDPAKRLELARRVSQIPDVSIPEESTDRFPSIPLASLRSPDSLQQLLKALDWAVLEVRSS